MPVLNKRGSDRPKARYKINKKLYQSSRWHRFSLEYLKSHRLCVMCAKVGITEIAVVTDHVVPIEEGGDIWAVSNMQALCLSCHGKKTIKEQKNRGQLKEGMAHF